MKSRIVNTVLVLGLLVIVCGCGTMTVVPLGSRTPTSCGRVQLYATDNVPFEFEELGFISLNNQERSQDVCLSQFCDQALELGADAVLLPLLRIKVK